MNATNNTQAHTHFDSVLYARAYVNEVKIINLKKGDKYCAINASIIGTYFDDNGAPKKSYTTIDLIVKGKPAKEILWALRDRWPTDRLKREAQPWIADINIGSIRSEAFDKKKDDTVGAVLKGRLLNIRALKIGDDLIHGEWDEELPQPMLHAVCYVNKLDLVKGRGKIAMLDGPVTDYTSKTININFNADDFAVFGDMEALKVIPKGYANRKKNAKVFALMTLTGLNASGFKNDKGDKLSALWADLQDIRYLKADDHVLVGKKDAA